MEHVFIFVPDMKFLCPTLWLGGLSTDKENDDNNKNTGHTMDKARLYQIILYISQMSQKFIFQSFFYTSRHLFEDKYKNSFVSIMKAQVLN